MCAGAKGIFTMHSSSIKEIMQNEELAQIIKDKIIQRVIVLDKHIKGEIKEMF